MPREIAMAVRTPRRTRIAIRIGAVFMALGRWFVDYGLHQIRFGQADRPLTGRLFEGQGFAVNLEICANGGRVNTPPPSIIGERGTCC